MCARSPHGFLGYSYDLTICHGEPKDRPSAGAKDNVFRMDLVHCNSCRSLENATVVNRSMMMIDHSGLEEVSCLRLIEVVHRIEGLNLSNGGAYSEV